MTNGSAGHGGCQLWLGFARTQPHFEIRRAIGLKYRGRIFEALAIMATLSQERVTFAVELTKFSADVEKSENTVGLICQSQPCGEEQALKVAPANKARRNQRLIQPAQDLGLHFAIAPASHTG